MEKTIPYIQILREELAQRSERNSRYSIRALARSLALDPGTVSRLLNGKQVPSAKMAKKILERLELSPERETAFMASLGESQRARKLERIAPGFKTAAKEKPADLSIEMYRVLADWQHFAILELSYVRGFKADARWISKELGISPADAKLALERLLSLGFLKERNGKLVKAANQLYSADKQLTTAAHKKNQRQFLEKAITSLVEDPIGERNHSSMTMAIDPSKLPTAKQMIQDFSRVLCAYLESGSRRRVYNLNVCLFPIQRTTKENES